MALPMKKLEDQTIVITGATTGIGLATARLVLAARDESTLHQLSEEIQRQGGETAYAVADVANAGHVHNIARIAIDRFGGFDTWINNAGVSIFGNMLDIKPEAHRRLFETNYWGGACTARWKRHAIFASARTTTVARSSIWARPSRIVRCPFKACTPPRNTPSMALPMRCAWSSKPRARRSP